MNRVSFASNRLAPNVVALAALVCVGLTAVQVRAQESDNSSGVLGRVEFQSGNLPPATVEVDLSQSMFRDLFGLGDAAVAGVAEAIMQSLDTQGDSPEMKLAADQLEAARQGLQLASDVIREVRIRVHAPAPDQLELIEQLNSHFSNQLDATGWDHIVRARQDEESVRVSVLRSDGAVRGLFVIAGNDEGIVLANIVCDISPENVKKLTAAATKIGLENGLRQALETELKALKRHAPPEPPKPPREPRES
jgi:hypothetical protein